MSQNSDAARGWSHRAGQRRDTSRMKNYMMIKQRVADFAQFQTAFDELLPRRREFGLIDIGTSREASEPDTVVVLMEVTDVARAKEYWHSQVLEAGRRKAGVVGPLQAGTDQVSLTNGPVIQEPSVWPGKGRQSRADAGTTDHKPGRRDEALVVTHGEDALPEQAARIDTKALAHGRAPGVSASSRCPEQDGHRIPYG